MNKRQQAIVDRVEELITTRARDQVKTSINAAFAPILGLALDGPLRARIMELRKLAEAQLLEDAVASQREILMDKLEADLEEALDGKK